MIHCYLVTLDAERRHDLSLGVLAGSYNAAGSSCGSRYVPAPLPRRRRRKAQLERDQVVDGHHCRHKWPPGRRVCRTVQDICTSCLRGQRQSHLLPKIQPVAPYIDLHIGDALQPAEWIVRPIELMKQHELPRSLHRRDSPVQVDQVLPGPATVASVNVPRINGNAHGTTSSPGPDKTRRAYAVVPDRPN